MNLEFYKEEANGYLKLKKSECSHIEYKSSEKQLDSILKTICAYGNNYYDNDYAFIFIGVEEENNSDEKAIPILPIKGIEEAHLEIAKNKLLNLRPCIQPNVQYDVLINNLEGIFYLLIVVTRQTKGPYEINLTSANRIGISLKSGRYVRIDAETRIARIYEEYELLRKFSNYHFSSEVNKDVTIDVLDYDYLMEYLKVTSERELSDNLTKHDLARMFDLFSNNESSTRKVKNFAILMFSRNPEKIIPYSYIEIISDVFGSKDKMEEKDFKGPIWKQYYSAIQYIENNFIRVLVLRNENEAINHKIYNFPFKAVEELLANAIVHKDYETNKTIQIYINKNTINIVNYNRPLPPITLDDLNNKNIFIERDSINPEIRTMFKNLGIIENYGTGIAEARKACYLNGSDKIYFKLFNDSVNITSVVIPCNKMYTDIISGNDIKEDKKVGSAQKKWEAMENKDYYISAQNIANSVGIVTKSLENEKQKNEKVGSTQKKWEVENNLKIDIIETIKSSNNSILIKRNMSKIFIAFSNIPFGSKNIMELLKVGKNTATKYLKRIKDLNLIVEIKGKGYGRYMFIKEDENLEWVLLCILS